MVEQERRKHPRHELRVKAKLVTADQSIPVIMTNIGEEGVQMEADTAVPEGTEVALSLQLAEETLLNGEVVWLLDTYVDGKIICLIGMEIEAIVFPEIQAMGMSDNSQMVQEIISWFEDHHDASS
jgi:hypothetical protein